ncbi:MAG: hypothetical protein KJZ77_00150 [Anaerolineales bacterium]|nr:hypothetical protein [Anaerolineales bacterium]
MSTFTESTIEQAAIDWLQELGYSYVFGPEIALGDIVCVASLRESLLLKLMRGK